LRPDDVRGRGYAPRGRTPVVRVCHKRTSLSLISAVANKGELRWMIVDGAVNAPTLIRFLERLIREARHKVFLILDRLRVHRARLVRDWLAGHSSEIEVHDLPAYSPDLNPDEGVNADLKQAVPRRAPARSKPQLRRAAISQMRSLSKRPHRIRSIFRHPQFRYAT
jgi:transposase